MRINRRQFIKKGLLAVGSMSTLPGMVAANQKSTQALKLIVLHTNDIHSHLDPMATGEYKGLGGAAARSSIIKRMREQFPHVLTFDSGDLFQGTPYFNLFQGEPEVKVMSATGYDAMTIGNHDFDAGVERLAELTESEMNFPLLNCNYDLSRSPLDGLVKEYIIKEMDGLRVGVMGLGIKLEGLVMPGLFEGVIYRNPIQEARRVARILVHEEKADYVIALSHINHYASEGDREPGDRDIIREIPEIDLVLGGHNHLLFPRPEVYMRREGFGMINQAGWAGTHIGMLNLEIFERKRVEVSMAENLPVFTA